MQTFVEIDLPTSKSISNRLLILQDINNHVFKIKSLSKADDSQQMFLLLQEKKKKLQETHFNVGNCGTAFRFLTAYLATQKGKWIIDGCSRLRQRPISSEVECLQSLGADIVYLKEKGYAPLQIIGKELHFSTCTIDANQSSQFVSALCMILPIENIEKTLIIKNLNASKSYVQQTVSLMQNLGYNIDFKENKIHYFPHNKTTLSEVEVEKDWSAAAFWYAYIANHFNKKLFLKGLKYSYLQGDVIIAKWMEAFGVQSTFLANGVLIEKKENIKPKNFIADCSNNLDLVPLLIVLCVSCGIGAKLQKVQNLQYKESNRIKALQQELKAFSEINLQENDIIVVPRQTKFPNTYFFSSYDDHRIAMCLMLLDQQIQDIHIDNVECVQKSYPNFWEEYKKMK